MSKPLPRTLGILTLTCLAACGGETETPRGAVPFRVVATTGMIGDMAARIASGPTFAHGITKTQLNQEWSMGLDQAIECRPIEVIAFALSLWRIIPTHTECRQCTQDLVFGIRPPASLIDIFDPDQPFAAMVTGIGITGHCRDQ